jgi:hypothetical protein
VEGVTYLVSGGGAAPLYFVERTPEDLYKSILFPHSTVRFCAYRFSTESKDSFDVVAKAR